MVIEIHLSLLREPPELTEMMNKKKFNLIWAILCVIPFLWIYPYWKLQKLPQGLIINVLPPLLFFGLWYFGDHRFIFIFLGGASTSYGNIIPNVFFIRRWGKKWNHQIESAISNSESQDSESDSENSKSQK